MQSIKMLATVFLAGKTMTIMMEEEGGGFRELYWKTIV